MPAPLAYFLTWTCYGQRLHGDGRGSVDRAHNVPGTPFLPADPPRERLERESMRGDQVSLTPAMRGVVDSAIVHLCDDRRWMLLARNARTTHVHVVADCRGDISPERALALFKARVTLALRQSGLVEPDARLWTYHGSTRWINTYPGLYGAIAYVNEWQSGPNKTILEEHRRLVRTTIESHKAWRTRKTVRNEPRTM